MSFKDLPFAARMNAMGDEAEAACVAAMESIGRPIAPFGLNRPPISLAQVPARIRHLPDFLWARGLIEAQGVGADQIVKLKLEKWNVLLYWNQVFAVELFVWDSKNRRWTLATMDNLLQWIDGGHAELGYFPEPRCYLAFHTEAFPEWVTVDG